MIIPYVESGFWVMLSASVWFFLFLFSFVGVGYLFLPEFYNHLRKMVFSSAIGMFFCALWIFVVGSFGCLNRWSVGLFLVVGVGIFIKKGAFPRLFETIIPRLDRGISTLLWLAFACVSLITFIAVMAPAIGNDDLNYHLYFPKLYVAHGAIVHDPHHPRSLWPYFMEMLYTAGLLFQGVALAKLFSWFTVVLSVFSVVSAVSLVIPTGYSTLAMACMGFIPALWMQSLYAYVDIAVMLYTFLSFLSLWIWKERGYKFPEALISAIFIAALLSLKYFSLIPFFILVILFSLGKDFKKKISSMGIMAGFCMLLSAFWYVRSWWFTGNPVFPFLHKLFRNGFEIRAIGYAEHPKKFLNFLMTPWNLSVHKDSYGGEPIGILFLVLSPLFLFLLKKRKEIPPFIQFSFLFAIGYFLCWFFTIQHARFFFPMFPFLALILVWAFHQWQKEAVLQKTMICLVVGVVVLSFLWSLYYPLRLMKGALGITNAHDFLKQKERSYAAFTEIAPYLKKEDKLLLVNEPRIFYSPVPVSYYGPVWEKKNIQAEGITCLLIRGEGDRFLREKGLFSKEKKSFVIDTEEGLIPYVFFRVY